MNEEAEIKITSVEAPPLENVEHRPLKELSAGLVAHYINEARLFAEQYLDYIGRTEFRAVSRDDYGHLSASPMEKKLQPLAYLMSDAKRCVRDCFHPDSGDSLTQNKSKNYLEFGMVARDASGRFGNIMACLAFIADFARQDLEIRPLDEEQKKKYDRLNPDRAQSLVNGLKLCQMYCGYSQMFKDAGTKAPNAGGIRPVRKYEGVCQSAVQQLRYYDKTQIDGQIFSRLTGITGVADKLQKYKTGWSAGMNIAKDELQGPAGERIANMPPTRLPG